MTNPVSGIAQRKNRLFRARETLDLLEEAGEVVVIHEHRGRWILPPQIAKRGPEH